MSKSRQRFSLSRFFKSVLERGTPTNYELDTCNELGRSLSPGWKSKRGEPVGYLVPSSAFDSPLTRDVTVGGSGAHLVGRKVQQFAGVVGWSAVAQNATIIGPFKDSDVMVYHDNPLPPVTWQPEIGAVGRPGFDRHRLNSEKNRRAGSGQPATAHSSHQFRTF